MKRLSLREGMAADVLKRIFRDRLRVGTERNAFQNSSSHAALSDCIISKKTLNS